MDQVPQKLLRHALIQVPSRHLRADSPHHIETPAASIEQLAQPGAAGSLRVHGAKRAPQQPGRGQLHPRMPVLRHACPQQPTLRTVGANQLIHKQLQMDNGRRPREAMGPVQVLRRSLQPYMPCWGIYSRARAHAGWPHRVLKVGGSLCKLAAGAVQLFRCSEELVDALPFAVRLLAF